MWAKVKTLIATAIEVWVGSKYDVVKLSHVQWFLLSEKCLALQLVSTQSAFVYFFKCMYSICRHTTCSVQVVFPKGIFFFIPLMCTRRAQYSTTRKSSGMEIKLKKYLKHLNIYLYFRNVLLYQTRLFHNLFPGIRKLVYLIYCLPAIK